MSALVVACLALIFAVSSFWWLNARCGRLESYAPATFAAYVAPGNLRVRLPLVLYNTGATPIVVRDLRLVFSGESCRPLPWRNTRKTLMPEAGDVEDLPSVFSVDGRTAHRLFVEFATNKPEVVMVGRPFPVVVQYLGGPSSNWKGLVSFQLLAQGIAYPGNYIAYPNRTELLEPDNIVRATEAAKPLLNRGGN